ncbi:hypothetical protein C8N35_10983 [Breoghania corrubedonensis]|uniref:Membrane-bound lysozyme inhibitor of c-type lysozyme MliC n=1 Tax=Breoghania corrubedonensis TaxID=665038 RepID=A0A2T5V4V6_9HYPH|nr:hypothetical protein [Breoghania corrubedonensis]PTW58779.1 hypothetical protein C8N35_10983 [Breoghania corrubedonensis]
MFRNIGYVAFAAASLLAAGTASAADWLQGTYVNGDKDSLMDEAIFCDGGKAYAGMGHRTYTLEERDGKTFVVLSSNGKFTFIVAGDGHKLLPADDFTKEWFTKTGLTKDPARTDTCNW